MRERLSYANVMATIAVFIALGGGAYAALGKNSVGTRQLKPDAVTGSKIKANAVRGPDIAAAQIKPSDLNGTTRARLTDGCRAGMTNVAGTVCLDTAGRGFQDFFTAVNTCINAGLRLPTVTEASLGVARGVLGGVGLWTDSLYREATQGAPNRAILVIGNSFGIDVTSQKNFFVCAADPSDG